MTIPASNMPGRDGGRLPVAYTTPGSASFVDFLGQVDPHTRERLDVRRYRPDAAAEPVDSGLSRHGTTIIAMETAAGVLMAGDRRATSGNVIASRDIVKVHAADAYSAVGIAGVAGVGLELIKLFQVELEHFEKIEGTSLSLEGKASRLASMIRGNLGLAMQGLTAIPLFAGYDVASGQGRIYSYDATGGRYPESDHHGIGSGSWFARGSLKKLWRRGMTEEQAVAVAVEALFDAADDDSATGGPDTVRRIWPVVAVVDAQGYREIDGDVLAAVVGGVVERRSAAALDGGEL